MTVADHLDMNKDSVQLPETVCLKTWKVKNTGTVAWPEETCAVFVGGNESMVVEGFQKVIVGAVEPNDVAYIRVMVNIPAVPGSYAMRYRLCTLAEKFGQKMVTKVKVEKPAKKSNMEPQLNRNETTDTLLSAVEEEVQVEDEIPDVILDEPLEDFAPSAPRRTEEKPAEPEEKLEYPAEVAQLQAMGFDQEPKILDSILIVAKGNVSAAISNLM